MFICDEFEGEPKDREEGKLQWFKQEELPFAKMWADDRHWLPDVLGKKSVKKRFYFNQAGDLLYHGNLG